MILTKIIKGIAHYKCQSCGKTDVISLADNNNSFWPVIECCHCGAYSDEEERLKKCASARIRIHERF